MKYRIALPAICLMLAGCGSKGGDKTGTAVPPEQAATPVQAVSATRDSIERVVNAEAILYPVSQANVTSKITAPVKKFLVNRGDHVKQGQLLAILENGDLAAGVAEAKGNYNQVSSAYRTTTAGTMPDELTKAQTDVQTARQTLDAARKLYENRLKLQKEGALAQKLVDDAQVALVAAQSQYETTERHLQSLQNVSRGEQVKGLQAQVDSAKARYQSAEAQLDYSEIRSPIAGVVADRPLYVGETAASGSPIVSIMDISQVVARAHVPIKEAAGILAGKPATITAPDGTEAKGKVTVVSPAVDPNTTTIEVWVQAQNPGERLKPGTTVRVAIQAETIQNAVIVPAAALLTSEEGGEKVMVVGPDSLAHEHKVEIGVREQDKVQIEKGVRPGDRVITVGGLGLEDKAKVVIETPKPDEKGAEKAGP